MTISITFTATTWPEILTQMQAILADDPLDEVRNLPEPKVSFRKPIRDPRIDAEPDKPIMPEERRSSRQQGQVESCAYCGKDLTGKYQWHDMARTFCDKDHADDWFENPSRRPKSNDLPAQKEILPSCPTKCQDASHSDLRRQIKGYMDLGMKSDDIQKLLISEWDSHVSIGSIRSQMGQITKEQKKANVTISPELRAWIEEAKPVEPSQSPTEAKSPKSSNIPLIWPESEIYRLWKDDTFPFEIRAHMLRNGYPISVEGVKKIIRGFQA